MSALFGIQLPSLEDDPRGNVKKKLLMFLKEHMEELTIEGIDNPQVCSECGQEFLSIAHAGPGDVMVFGNSYSKHDINWMRYNGDGDDLDFPLFDPLTQFGPMLKAIELFHKYKTQDTDIHVKGEVKVGDYVINGTKVRHIELDTDTELNTEQCERVSDELRKQFGNDKPVVKIVIKHA